MEVIAVIVAWLLKFVKVNDVFGLFKKKKTQKPTAVFGVSHDVCMQAGPYRIYELPDVVETFFEGQPFPPYKGKTVTWVFDIGENKDENNESS